MYFILYLSSAAFFKTHLFKKFFQEHYQSVKRLDPDQDLDPGQDRHFVGCDLGQTVCKGFSRWQNSSPTRKKLNQMAINFHTNQNYLRSPAYPEYTEP